MTLLLVLIAIWLAAPTVVVVARAVDSMHGDDAVPKAAPEHRGREPPGTVVRRARPTVKCPSCPNDPQSMPCKKPRRCAVGRDAPPTDP
jgi:hypothetical protein